MGFRYRKSINLGNGFRLNLSKSGVGYSWGCKGFRWTKTAKGRTRKTYSIPGTGFSYVDESSGERERSAFDGPGTTAFPSISLLDVALWTTFVWSFFWPPMIFVAGVLGFVVLARRLSGGTKGND